MARSVDAVIFDFGGVLTANGRVGDIGSRFPPDVAEQARNILTGDYSLDTDHPWHRLERGEISLEENRALNRAALAAAGIATPPRPAGAASRGLHDIEFSLNTAVIELVHDLRSAGLKLGVLTNNIREFRPLWWPTLPFDELFDDVVDSSEVGMRKPNPAIYRLALERLGAVAGRTAFLDDVASNVAAARAVGMHGIEVAVDPADAVAQARVLAGLAPA